jgi:hypothetical protein
VNCCHTVPQPEPTVTINAPRLKVGHFLLSNLHSIDFHGSTFPSTIKELLVSTPCYSTLGRPTMMQASGTCWTHQNFLAAYPEVEMAVIAGQTMARAVTRAVMRTTAMVTKELHRTVAEAVTFRTKDCYSHRASYTITSKSCANSCSSSLTFRYSHM